jgi:two-component system CheB/CheR fusion protein
MSDPESESPVQSVPNNNNSNVNPHPEKPPKDKSEEMTEKWHPFPIVAIGASAGGLEAITKLLQNLSPNTGMAFIYVQHLSPDHKSMLTPLLSKVTSMKVQDIEDMDRMLPDNVYVIPYNKEIEVTDGHIKLIPRSQNKTSNLSIDVLFSSLAETHKENVVGIVLSGSANDGTRGLKEIKLAGGITFAQDDSAKFSSMPHSAIAEGVVDFILSPEEIGKELTWMSQHPLVKRIIPKNAPEDEIDNSNPDLKDVLLLIHKRKNVDFSHYKMNTIKRRMLRRMLINKKKSIQEYAVFLGQKEEEIDLLFQDLLINVTDFFRDTDAFLILKTTVLPRLLKSKGEGETLRIWVPACATGEEVYSIAMLLLEIQENKTHKVPFQIFASDLSIAAISKARIGEYSLQQMENVSPKRIQHFFTKTKDVYRITRALRDVCIFAQHNILSDPPFSRMDFISCRNFLIYLDTSAQKKTLATLHYALNDGGYLLLGKSEAIGSSAPLFTLLNKKFKFYSRKKNTGAVRMPDLPSRILNLPAGSALLPGGPEKSGANLNISKKFMASTNGNIGSTFDNLLLTHFMPASVLINYDLEILQFRGDTSLYLQHAPGIASFNILKMAHIEITFELRNAIHHAIKTNQKVRKPGIEMNRDIIQHTVHVVNLEVMPIKMEGEDPFLVVIFSGQRQQEPIAAGGVKHNSIAKDRRIKKLEEELAAARSDMGTITQDQDAANEELQSANEEIVSSNEELQSLNEELETSKEEIESTNEELTTSNHELFIRIQQVEDLYAYNEAIIATVHEPVLILDKNIRIKSANQSFCKIFHVTEEECLGVSLYKLGNSQWNIPQLRELLEDIVPKNIRFHDFEVQHEFPVIGQKTMMLNAHRIIRQSANEELIVLTIADITDIKRLAIELQVKENKILEVQLEAAKRIGQEIADSNKRYNMLLMKSPFAFAVFKGENMIITLANPSIKELWGKGDQVEGKPLLQVLPELNNQEFPALLRKVYNTGIPFYGDQVFAPLLRNGITETTYFNFVYQPYLEADESISGVTVIAYEVTDHVIAKNQLLAAKINAEEKTQIAEEAVKAKQQFLSNMSHEIRTPMNAIIGFTNVLLKTALNDRQNDYINAIKTAGDALIVLINDILDLAKVDAGKMNFEHIPFNLMGSITAVLQLFEPKIKEKNLLLEEDYDPRIPPVLLGDPMRLRQILLNLIGNAVKFTNKGIINIHVQLLHEDAQKVTLEFTLTDTGIGIPEERLDHIFNDFEQAAQGTTSSYGGTGLGLAIVKKLVELQGGTISVKSKMGQGSTFGLILSFLKRDASEVSAPENNEVPEQLPLLTTTEKQAIKILVAEDITLNQLLIKIMIEDFGFEIEIVNNGKIAIEKLQQNKYDIILMDLRMPQMNGFEATTYIRNTLNDPIPIIALTADVTTVDVAKCIEVGMNDYISKPIDEKILYDKILKYLKTPDVR